MVVLHRFNVSRRDIVEVVLLIAIPAVLWFIYYLTPIAFQHRLVLDHTDPALRTFWSYSLVHEHQPDDAHLISNTEAYAFLVFPCWLLYRQIGQKRRFWIGFVVLLSLGAVVSGVSSYVVFHQGLGLEIQNDRGFSGVIGAIDGFLLTSILYAVSKTQKEDVAILSMGIFFGYLVLGYGTATSGLPLIILGSAILFGTILSTNTEYVATFDDLADWLHENRRFGALLVVSIFVTALGFAASLPENIVSQSGGLKNIVAHGSGIIFGMIVGYSSYYLDA